MTSSELLSGMWIMEKKYPLVTPRSDMGVAMCDVMMLPVEWSTRLCESCPCHVKMDGCV
jgi:hypothetical protein